MMATTNVAASWKARQQRRLASGQAGGTNPEAVAAGGEVQQDVEGESGDQEHAENGDRGEYSGGAWSHTGQITGVAKTQSMTRLMTIHLATPVESAKFKSGLAGC